MNSQKRRQGYDCADRLTQYSVMPRYPNEIEVDEPMTRKALEDATDLINWVNRIIESPSQRKAERDQNAVPLRQQKPLCQRNRVFQQAFQQTG